jgi:hypothetical protein
MDILKRGSWAALFSLTAFPVSLQTVASGSVVLFVYDVAHLS